MASDDSSNPDDPRLATLRELFDGVYAVHEGLTWGGLALVYRATEPGRELALAVPPIDCSDPAHAASFEAIAERMGALNHAGLLTPTDSGIEEGVPFVEYELVPARTLREVVDAGPLSVEAGAELAQQLTEALASAHAVGLAHGDLTPSTVLIEDVDGEQVVRVFGTGIAAAIHATRDTKLTGPTGRGSGPRAARFLAPELRFGQAPSPRADIYSVGALVLYATTGVEPDRDPGPVGEPVASRPALAAVVERALAASPDARFEDMAAMREAVLEAMAASGIPSLPPRPPSRRPEPPPREAPGVGDGSPEPAAPSRRKHAALVAAVLAVIAALLYVLRGPSGVVDSTVGPPPVAGSAPAAAAPGASPGDTSPTPSPSAEAPAPVAIPEAPPEPTGATEEVEESIEEGTNGGDAPEAGDGGRGPLATDLPEELAAELARVEAGERFEPADFDRLFGYAARNRGDVRVYLVMARAYMAREWLTAAATRYTVAVTMDPAACEDDHLLPDLLRIATTEGGEEKILRAFRTCVDASDVPAIEAAIAQARRGDARRRLGRLRDRAARTRPRSSAEANP